MCTFLLKHNSGFQYKLVINVNDIKNVFCIISIKGKSNAMSIINGLKFYRSLIESDNGPKVGYSIFLEGKDKVEDLYKIKVAGNQQEMFKALSFSNAFVNNEISEKLQKYICNLQSKLDPQISIQIKNLL
jgi:hypothetical protein